MYCTSVFGILMICLASSLANKCKPKDDREKYSSCSECIKETEEGCGWCLDKVDGGLVKGCVAKTECKSTFLGKSNTAQGQGGRGSYIEPSKLKLEMSPNIKKTIKIKGRKAQNAVDIYFLLDLTGSMQPLKAALASIPEELAESIKERTSDYQFGYGTFLEKPMPPFAKLSRNSQFNDDFKHMVSMTNQTEKLIQTIKRSRVKGNLDTPEAGLDGLMQVLLCDQKVGWRSGSTGIIVLITDAPSHIAGDGILGGIWKSYNHACTLQTDSQGVEVYDSLEYDYPSLGEVNYLVDRKQRSVIIGTTENVVDLYQQIVDTKVIEHAAVGNLGTNRDPDAAVLKNLVIGEYNKIDGQLNMAVKNLPPGVTIKLTSKCSNKWENGLEVVCNKVKVNEEIDFEAEIEVKPSACQGKDLKFTIQIFGQSSSILEVDLTPVCKCKASACPKPNDSICRINDAGATMECGACKCSSRYQGDFCECDTQDRNSNELEDQCMAGGQVCSGHGICKCGKCQCSPGHHGKYCGCGDRQWRKCGSKGLPKCVQSPSQTSGEVECTCKYGWSGDTCSCTSSNDQCMDPITGTKCNNDGACKCNKCACNNKQGQYCQKNNAVQGKLRQEETCKRIGPCILLDIFDKDPDVNDGTKDKWRDECEVSNRYDCFYLVNATNTNRNDSDLPFFNTEDETTTEAPAEDDAGNKIYTTCRKGQYGDDTMMLECSADVPVKGRDCKMRFRHDAKEGFDNYDSSNWQNTWTVYVNYNEDNTPYECPDTIPTALLVGVAAGGALGLFIIVFVIYCCVINIKDRREYKKFMELKAELEQDETAAKGNALFKERKSNIRQSIRNRMSRVTFAK